MTREFELVFELAYKANTVIFVLAVISLLLSPPGTGARVVSAMTVGVSALTYGCIYAVLWRRD